MAGAGAKPFVDAKIAQRKVMMFSKRYSPDCKFVRKILDGFNMTPEVFEIVEIESRQDCSQIQNYFQTLCLTDSREVCMMTMAIYDVELFSVEKR